MGEIRQDLDIAVKNISHLTEVIQLSYYVGNSLAGFIAFLQAQASEVGPDVSENYAKNLAVAGHIMERTTALVADLYRYAQVEFPELSTIEKALHRLESSQLREKCVFALSEKLAVLFFDLIGDESRTADFQTATLFEMALKLLHTTDRLCIREGEEEIFGDYLVAKGLIDHKTLQDALKFRDNHNVSLKKLIGMSGVLTGRQVKREWDMLDNFRQGLPGHKEFWDNEKFVRAMEKGMLLSVLKQQTLAALKPLREFFSGQKAPFGLQRDLQPFDRMLKTAYQHCDILPLSLWKDMLARGMFIARKESDSWDLYLGRSKALLDKILQKHVKEAGQAKVVALVTENLLVVDFTGEEGEEEPGSATTSTRRIPEADLVSANEKKSGEITDIREKVEKEDETATRLMASKQAAQDILDRMEKSVDTGAELEERPPAKTTAIMEGDRPVQTLKIMLVDDDPRFCNMMASLLKMYQMASFTDPLHALENISQIAPDLLLLDYSMPEIDGLEFLKIVKRRMPELPVIMVTGHQSTSLGVSAIRIGAYDCISKPFSPKTLLDKIAEAKNSQSERGWTCKGDLASTSLLEVLQICTTVQHSGRLSIESKDNRAQVYFADGNIVHAKCGQAEGFKALVRIATFSRGSFEFISTNVDCPVTIEADPMMLFLEMARQLDEWMRLTVDFPDMRHRICLTPEARDPIVALLQNAPLSIQEILDASEDTDMEVLESLSALREKGIVQMEKTPEK